MKAGTGPVLDVRLADRLELRKPHACGGKTWRVVRVGMDIGILCETCRHRVMLERRELERRLRAWVERAERAEPADASDRPDSGTEA